MIAGNGNGKKEKDAKVGVDGFASADLAPLASDEDDDVADAALKTAESLPLGAEATSLNKSMDKVEGDDD